MITIQELLDKRGLKEYNKIKLVRHKDTRFDIYDMYRHNREAFLEYQSRQTKPVFHNTECIVSFIGEESNRARFVGVYKIIGAHEFAENDPKSNGDKYLY